MKAIFSRIAGRYDHMNHVMSLMLDRRWRHIALKSVTNPPKSEVLDLACGTGDFSAEVLRRFPDADITGMDITPEMLDIARKKLAETKDIRFVTGDAHDLSRFPDGLFGLIVCGFGFRNFSDKDKVLAECRRVLAHGGELVVLELFRPASRILGAFVNLWLAATAAAFAGGNRSEYAYLRHSISGTASVDEFVELARAAGFTVRKRQFLFPAATCLALA